MAFVINVIKWLLWTVETLYKVIGIVYVLSEFTIPFWCETLVNTPSKHDVDPMLVQCWPTICDAGPTSNQHRLNASCLLGCVQPSKHKQLLSFVKCFGMFWKSKKLQVRDYLFKWTEFFPIKYVRSWVIGLPNHPQLWNYMTLSFMILFTLLWFLESGWLNKSWPYVVLMLVQRRRQWPRMKYRPNHVVTSAFIIPSKH